LQILGAGRNHYSFAGENRRNQVRQGLARPSSCFDNQVLLLGERTLGGFRHGQLAGAVLEVRMPLGKQSFTAKELADGEWFDCGRHLLHDFSSRHTYFFDIATDFSTSHWNSRNLYNDVSGRRS
jgi:hypothetical protein